MASLTKGFQLLQLKRMIILCLASRQALHGVRDWEWISKRNPEVLIVSFTYPDRRVRVWDNGYYFHELFVHHRGFSERKKREGKGLERMHLSSVPKNGQNGEAAFDNFFAACFGDLLLAAMC